MKTYAIKDGHEHRTANVTVETEPGDYFTPTRIKNGRYLQVHPYLESRGFEVVRQAVLPAFRVGLSPRLLRERLRLVRKRIPYRYNQLAVCRPGASA